MMRLLFDIETDNFLDKMTCIHCIVVRDVDTDVVKTFSSASKDIKAGLAMLRDADMLIGHNIIDFDIRAIKKLYPKWTTKAYIYDTLIACKVGFSDIKSRDFASLRKVMNKEPKLRTDLEKLRMRNIGKHSLEAYGVRMGEYKGTFGKEVGFETYSQEMLDYCIQDVNVNLKLFKKLEKLDISKDILDIEFEAQRICLAQTEFGFNFDIESAKKLEKTLLDRREELSNNIKSQLGGAFIIPLEVKVPKRTTRYKEVLRGTYTVGCAYTKIKVKEFNPNSRHDVATRLQERCGWKPKVFGEDKKPTLSEEVLSKLDIPVAKDISEYMMIDKRLGMLSNGRQAWMSLYNEETKSIHGRVNTLGAASSRCTHSQPNLAQIPAVRSPYGKECRALFTTPKGWKLFGTDAAGLELRMLAHYMAAFDGGAYADVVLNGDIHTKNQEAAGLSTRPKAKTFMYAKIYGSGINNLARVCGMSIKDMKATVARFDKNLPALKQLTDAVKLAVKTRGYVKALDGRKIYVTSEHAALNYLLQSAGAIVCKNWMVEFHRLIKEGGMDGSCQQLAWVHDEFQVAYDPSKITGETLGDLSAKAMNNVATKFNTNIELGIDWSVGSNYADTH